MTLHLQVGLLIVIFQRKIYVLTLHFFLTTVFTTNFYFSTKKVFITPTHCSARVEIHSRTSTSAAAAFQTSPLYLLNTYSSNASVMLLICFLGYHIIRFFFQILRHFHSFFHSLEHCHHCHRLITTSVNHSF